MVIMKKYGLTSKTGDVITTISANNFEEDIYFFCFRKNFDRYTLLNVFDVVEIKN